MVRTTYNVGADNSFMLVEMMPHECCVGKHTHIVKKSGIWPVAVRYRGRELARLEQPGDGVRLLAILGGWMAID